MGKGSEGRRARGSIDILDCILRGMKIDLGSPPYSSFPWSAPAG